METIVDEEGNKYWLQNNKYHRDDGPAVEYVDGSKLWYKEGKLHRLDGPAIIYSNVYKKWYYNGEEIKCSSTEEFLRLIKLKAFW